MRRVAAMVVVGLALAGRAAADPVAALPVLAELRTGPTAVVVRGELDPVTARAALREIRAVYDDVARRFVSPAAARPAVTLCLFAT